MKLTTQIWTQTGRIKGEEPEVGQILGTVAVAAVFPLTFLLYKKERSLTDKHSTGKRMLYTVLCIRN